MTTTDDSTMVRLSGRSALLATVPALLGFHPRDSLVMLCLTGPRRRVGPVLRADLNDRQPGLAQYLADHAVRHGSEVVLVAYTDRAGSPVLLRRLLAELERRGLGVLDALIVRDGHAWPARQRDGDQPVPVPDADDPAVQEITAALALHGRAVLPDRQALARSVAGPAGSREIHAINAFAKAADELLELLESTGPGAPDPLVQLAVRTSRAALRATAEGSGPDLAGAARLALLAADLTVRDELITLSFTELDQPWLPTLIAVVSQIPDREAIEVCAALALLAYRHGDGALAQVVADRVLAVDPDHRLVGMLLSAMSAGMPPSTIAELAGPADGEVRATG